MVIILLSGSACKKEESDDRNDQVQQVTLCELKSFVRFRDYYAATDSFAFYCSQNDEIDSIQHFQIDAQGHAVRLYSYQYRYEDGMVIRDLVYPKMLKNEAVFKFSETGEFESMDLGGNWKVENIAWDSATPYQSVLVDSLTHAPVQICSQNFCPTACWCAHEQATLWCLEDIEYVSDDLDFNYLKIALLTHRYDPGKEYLLDAAFTIKYYFFIANSPVSGYQYLDWFCKGGYGPSRLPYYNTYSIEDGRILEAKIHNQLNNYDSYFRFYYGN